MAFFLDQRGRCALGCWCRVASIETPAVIMTRGKACAERLEENKCTRNALAQRIVCQERKPRSRPANNKRRRRTNICCRTSQERANTGMLAINAHYVSCFWATRLTCAYSTTTADIFELVLGKPPVNIRRLSNCWRKVGPGLARRVGRSMSTCAAGLDRLTRSFHSFQLAEVPGLEGSVMSARQMPKRQPVIQDAAADAKRGLQGSRFGGCTIFCGWHPKRSQPCWTPHVGQPSGTLLDLRTPSTNAILNLVCVRTL